MFRVIPVILLLVCLHGTKKIYGQDTTTVTVSNLKEKIIFMDSLFVELGSVSIEPTSLSVFTWPEKSELSPDQYKLEGNVFSVIEQKLQGDTLLLNYRYLPKNLTARSILLDSANLNQQFQGQILAYEFTPESTESSMFGPGIQYSGSFSRGISIGSAQDLVLNSNFNLQLAGQIGSDTEILAAITDNNIPIQPEGNTQQIQDFDKVFIELRQDNFQLIAGDYEISRPESYFLNYTKKLQGASANHILTLDNGHQLKTEASLAVSKGKFARQQIQQIEGNQGPYKLKGNNGEFYVTVLAGTEKVYLDGKLMERGKERDYIIDYNRAEVSFTPNQIITKDSRIIVEFEYAVQQYRRTLVTANLDYYTSNGHYYSRVYSEQDSKSANTFADSEEKNRTILRSAGDNIDGIIGNGIDTVPLDERLPRVLYIKIDTTLEIMGRDTQLSIFKYQPGSKGHLEVTFIDIGENKGTYQISENASANGRVYKWVGVDPNTGQPLGRYHPGKPLTAPKSKQVFTFGTNQRLSSHFELNQELAMSIEDLNRYSTIGDRDNVGFASRTEIEYQSSKAVDKQSENIWGASLSYELITQEFSVLNPYRAPEFNRDWNLSQLQTNNEHWLVLEGKYQKLERGNILGRFEYVSRPNSFTAIKPSFQFDWNERDWQVNSTVSYLNTESHDVNSTFFRPKINLSFSPAFLKSWRIGSEFEHESNQIYKKDIGRISPASFRFDQSKIYLASPENKKLFTEISYLNRVDFTADSLSLKQVTQAENIAWKGTWIQSPSSKLNWQFTWRDLDIVRDELMDESSTSTYLGRIDYNIHIMDGFIHSNSSYEIGTGQEAKFTYNYLETEPGRGNFIWIDRNQDSIQQIDEFELAPFTDQGKYVRLTILSDEFIPTDIVKFNYNLRLSPKKIVTGSSNIHMLLKRLSSSTSINITNKHKSDNGITINPFSYNPLDNRLISSNAVIRNTLFINRLDPTFSFQITSLKTQTKSTTTSGSEHRSISNWSFRGKYRFNDFWASDASYLNSDNRSNNEIFESRDFDISQSTLEVGISLQGSKAWNGRIAYDFTQKQNQSLQEEVLQQHTITLNWQWNHNNKSTFTSELNWVEAQYDGPLNTPVTFEMLEGLANGRNLVWSLGYEKRLLNNMKIKLSYSGRQLANASVIHIGRVEVGALF